MLGQRPAFPHGQPTVTTTLNDGVSGTALVATLTTFARVYAAGADGTYHLQADVTYATPTGFLFVYQSTTANPPSQNTAGVINPPTAATVTPQHTVPSWAAGTYQIAYTYVTNLGETSLSPPVTFVSDGTETPVVTVPAPGTIGGYVTVELNVPRLEEWHVTRYAIYTSTANLIPSVILFLDAQAPRNILDTTALGNQNSANADLTLRPGQRLICQWTDIDQGATATLSVFGEKTTLP